MERWIVNQLIGLRVVLMGPVLCSLLTASVMSEERQIGAVPVEIQSRPEGHQLLRDGQPYHIKGAVYWADPKGRFPLSDLRARGANSVRCGGRHVPRIFAEAAELGMTVTVGLPLRGEYTDGFDYSDEAAVQRQFEEIRRWVLRYKDHPALLMWGIGNEWSLWHKNDKVFDAVEDVARMIHDIDGRHPTMTVTGDNPFDRPFIETLKERCPSIDVLGVNIYQGLIELPEKIRQVGWDKPYCVTEWGPTGHWQVPKTAWRIPIEETSTEKAAIYRRRYEAAIEADRSHCLGSYVFFWGQKQERTHTWYGMFLASGERLETVDVMQSLWTSQWPENRSPQLRSLTMDGKEATDSVYLRAGHSHVAMTDTVDPDGDALRLQWEILTEPTEFGYGGRGERRPQAVAGGTLETIANTIRFEAPQTEGPYRFFVYVFDGRGNAATGNIPFFIKP